VETARALCLHAYFLMHFTTSESVVMRWSTACFSRWGYRYISQQQQPHGITASQNDSSLGDEQFLHL